MSLSLRQMGRSLSFTRLTRAHNTIIHGQAPALTNAFTSTRAPSRRGSHRRGRLRRNSESARASLLPKCAALLLALFSWGIPAWAQRGAPRFEVAPVFAHYHQPGLRDVNTDQLEIGGRFAWNWLPHLSLEAEYASTLEVPRAASESEGGIFSQALFGIKSGVRGKSWGLFAKFRPGFVSSSQAIVAATVSATTAQLTFGRLNNAAFDLGGGAEFFLSRRWLFRYDAGDLIVHQGPHGFLFNGQKVTFAPFTVNNFESEISVAFRF